MGQSAKATLRLPAVTPRIEHIQLYLVAFTCVYGFMQRVF